MLMLLGRDRIMKADAQTPANETSTGQTEHGQKVRPAGAQATHGFAKRFQKPRRTEEWMRLLCE